MIPRRFPSAFSLRAVFVQNDSQEIQPFLSLAALFHLLLHLHAFNSGDECGRGTQRGQPKHTSHEQPGHLAYLRSGGLHSARGPPQHPLLQCPAGVDAHQRHSQPRHVRVHARGQRHSVRDSRPGQGQTPDALGAARLRHPVHLLQEVLHHLPHRPIFFGEFLHKIRHDALHHKHGVFTERSHPKTAPAPRSPHPRHQQVLDPVQTKTQLHGVRILEKNKY